MDYQFLLAEGFGLKEGNASFNPYFNGLSILTCGNVVDRARFKQGFNPYFNGLSILTTPHPLNIIVDNVTFQSLF